jgi:hypothetical protein
MLYRVVDTIFGIGNGMKEAASKKGGEKKRKEKKRK